MNNDLVLSNLLSCIYRRWQLADMAANQALADRERLAYLSLYPKIPV